MDKKTTVLTLASILTATLASAQSSSAHLEPKKGDGTEKCYGVAKAGKNDCASKVNKHSCAGRARVDADANEWIKMPTGLCKKLAGSSTEPKGKK